jgi:25S rRNA (adenine2142-N1)-methyltransferase
MRRKRQPVTQRKTVKDTQKTISEFHTLLKQKEQKQRELKLGFTVEKEQELAEIEQKVNAIGIDAYQKASIRSCEKGRGSCGRFLVQCIQRFQFADDKRKTKVPLLVLDVGAITGEEYLKYSFLNVTSIDLQVQSPLVIKCDFFEFPLPLERSLASIDIRKDKKTKNDGAKKHAHHTRNHDDSSSESDIEDAIQPPKEPFDILCLSLVLNFVPHPLKRGEMLLRAREMIKDDGWLYIVLPLPCLSNSRYFDQEHFVELMNSLGFQLVVCKNTKKLSSFVFLKNGQFSIRKFKKKELHTGKKRNNFCIVLE